MPDWGLRDLAPGWAHALCNTLACADCVPENRYALYNRIDIALDPFPYNGGTTSLDTLWMGVPFIALEGEHFVARMGHSILNNAGLPELSARTLDDYVALACRLGSEHAWREEIRRGLRERFAASPHMDHQLLADDMRDAWRAMWLRWLAQEPPVAAG
jgi:protein O-GlcNAc transferase